MEFVLVPTFRGATLIWMFDGESGTIKEFARRNNAAQWCNRSGIKYRWATYEETVG